MWSGQPADDTWYDHYRRWRWIVLGPIGCALGVYIVAVQDARVPFVRADVSGWPAVAFGLVLIALSAWAFFHSLGEIRAARE
jgi:hypothetical protein